MRSLYYAKVVNFQQIFEVYEMKQIKHIFGLLDDRIISFFILTGVFSGMIAILEQSTNTQGFVTITISSLVCIAMRVIWKVSYECIEDLGTEEYVIHIGVILSIMSFPVFSGAYQDNPYMVITILLFTYAFIYKFFMGIGDKIKEYRNCRDYG